MAAAAPTGDMESLLHSAFGFSSFRPNQEAVCRAAIEGRDVLLVMPTGPQVLVLPIARHRARWDTLGVWR